jgi:hypothetical protein
LGIFLKGTFDEKLRCMWFRVSFMCCSLTFARRTDMFSLWDADSSGSIDRAEMKRMLLALTDEASPDVDAMFDRLDLDRSGAIDFDEFARVCDDFVGLSVTTFFSSLPLQGVSRLPILNRMFHRCFAELPAPPAEL